jgi:hypothetical protein
VSFLAPAAGLRRALDAAVNEYQQGSQDFIATWSTRDGRFRPGFPSVVNDLQFLTGPTVADLDGKSGEELLGGTASQDLYAVGSDGRPMSAAWPKLTSDWMVSNPLVGSFGDPGHKVVVALTRSGTMLAYRTDALNRASARPVDAGHPVSIPLAGGRPKTVSVRAVDEQDNVGRAAAAGR